jgi:hypothetical protein
MQIRVLNVPMVHKFLINWHANHVVDHCIKMTYFRRSDTSKAPVVASLDSSGLVSICAFIKPLEEPGPDNPTGKLTLMDSLLVKIGPAPDVEQAASQGHPSGLVQVCSPYSSTCRPVGSACSACTCACAGLLLRSAWTLLCSSACWVECVCVVCCDSGTLMR